MLESDLPARPHSKNTARAEDNADIQVLEIALNGLRLLSERKPKKEEEMMPGTLKRVMRRVPEVAESPATECA